MKMRITNESQFAAQIKEFSERTGAIPKQVAQLIAGKIFEGVVERTPVDTGWARNSWNWTEGEVDPSVPPEPPKGSTLPEPQTPPAPKGGGDYPIYYITNNLPYIGELEAGRSKQAGKGFMIQRTLAAVCAEIAEILRDYE